MLKCFHLLSFSLHLHFSLQPLAKKTHLNKSLCMSPSSNDLYIFVFDSVSIATGGTTSQENHLSSGGQFFVKSNELSAADDLLYSLRVVFALIFLSHYFI